MLRQTRWAELIQTKGDECTETNETHIKQHVHGPHTRRGQVLRGSHVIDVSARDERVHKIFFVCFFCNADMQPRSHRGVGLSSLQQEASADKRNNKIKFHSIRNVIVTVTNGGGG